MLLIRSPRRSQSCVTASASIQDLTPLNAFPVELGLGSRTVDLKSALLTDGVRAVEDPVLPRGESPEDARQHSLGPGEAQARLHRGERIRREARALLDRETDLVFPVDVVRGPGNEPQPPPPRPTA